MSAQVEQPLTASLLADGGQVLRGLHVLHVNHRLADVETLSSLLAEYGANVTFVGIPYDEREWPIRSLTPWRDGVVCEVSEVLAGLPSRDLVVVEDGAYAVEAAVASGKTLRFAVEQTRYGHHVAQSLHQAGTLTFPVISCARSTVKCRVEAQFLAQRLAEILSSFLTDTGDFLVGRRVLVAGYGILGRPLAERLATAYCCRVSVLETNDVIADVALADGFKVARSMALVDDPPQVVVGASGTESVRWPDLACAVSRLGGEPLVLASVSSGDVEFRSALVDGLADGDRVQLVEQLPWGVRLAVDGTEVRLLADGRPINFFNSGLPSLAPAAADLINARLVEALLFEARRQGASGGRVAGWSTVEGEYPWLSDESFLRRFCDAARISTLGYPSAVAALRGIGLYDVHPGERELGLGDQA